MGKVHIEPETRSQDSPEIRKNLRDSSGRKHDDNLAIIAQADGHKFDRALKTLQRHDDNRAFLQLSNNEVLREIEKARAANHRSNNELLKALDKSRRMSQTQFNELLRDVICTSQTERITLFNQIRVDQHNVMTLLVVIAALTFILGKCMGKLEQSQRFLQFQGSSTAAASVPSNDTHVADFFNAALWGAGLVLVIGPGWTFFSYAMSGIRTVFNQQMDLLYDHGLRSPADLAGMILMVCVLVGCFICGNIVFVLSCLAIHVILPKAITCILSLLVAAATGGCFMKYLKAIDIWCVIGAVVAGLSPFIVWYCKGKS